MTLKPDAEISEADVKAFCKQHLHDWKCVKDLIFLDETPPDTTDNTLKEEVKRNF